MALQNGDTSRRARETGLSLIEVTCSMAVFALVLMSTGLTIMNGMSQRRESFEDYLAMNTLRNKIAEVQDTANQPQDLTAQKGIGAVFALVDGVTSTVVDLRAGQVNSTCYAKENAIPTRLGGNMDLNFDGDTADLLDNASGGTDLKLVPMELSITYTLGGSTITRTADRLVTKTTN